MDDNFERIKPRQDLDANVSSDDEPLINKFKKAKKAVSKRNSLKNKTYEESNILYDDIIEIDSDNDDKKEDPDFVPDFVQDDNKIDSPIEILEEEDLREEIKELNLTNSQQLGMISLKKVTNNNFWSQA